jgi:hypothetical protein
MYKEVRRSGDSSGGIGKGGVRLQSESTHFSTALTPVVGSHSVVCPTGGKGGGFSMGAAAGE